MSFPQVFRICSVCVFAIFFSVSQGAYAQSVPFIRGDANVDAAVDISDASMILSVLFLGGDMVPCRDSADVNADGALDVSDAVGVLAYLFGEGQQPPAPFPGCGVASTLRPVLGCESFSICPPGPGIPSTASLEGAIARFLSIPANSALFAGAEVRIESQVPASEIDHAVGEIVDSAAFLPDSSGGVANNGGPADVQTTPDILRLDSETIESSGLLARAQREYSGYVRTLVEAGDYLVSVTWNPAYGESFSTMGVISDSGEPRFEPILDLALTLSSSSSSRPVNGDGGGAAVHVGFDVHEWENILGIVKAEVALEVMALGADGCRAEFTASYTSSTAFPFVAEPGAAAPSVLRTCFPKVECTCRREPRPEENKMECGQSSQGYNVIARIGTQWFGADIRTYPGTLRAWACADGQAGRGNW